MVTQKWRRDFGVSISTYESEKKIRFGSSNEVEKLNQVVGGTLTGITNDTINLCEVASSGFPPPGAR